MQQTVTNCPGFMDDNALLIIKRAKIRDFRKECSTSFVVF
jgi:hypothetical protein